jgi:hypothetical protein
MDIDYFLKGVRVMRKNKKYNGDIGCSNHYKSFPGCSNLFRQLIFNRYTHQARGIPHTQFGQQAPPM